MNHVRIQSGDHWVPDHTLQQTGPNRTAATRCLPQVPVESRSTVSETVALAGQYTGHLHRGTGAQPLSVLI